MARPSLMLFFGYIVVFVVLQRILRRYYRVGRPARMTDAPGRLILMVLSSALLIPAVKSLLHQPNFTYAPIRVAGLVVVALGLFISLWAQSTLGQFWIGGIGLHKRHRLIVVGPYRYVRHPLYSGMIVSGVGMGIFSLNLLFALSAIVFCASFAVRIYAEEQILQSQFKEPYAAYKSKTGMLVPRLRRGG